MPTRSSEDSLRSLRDDRVVYARGERVEDGTEPPATRVSARHAAGAWDRQHERPEAFLHEGHSAYVGRPPDTDDLLARRGLTASAFAAWQEVTSLHSGGSMQVQHIAGSNGFDVASCERLVATDVGIDPEAGE